MLKLKVKMQARKRWVAVAAVAVAAAGGAAAYAAFPETDVTNYTGCLGTGGTGGGQITQVGQGTSPMKPCGSNQQVIHLSGGDITEVKVAGGLTGGGTNGSVTVGLDTAHSLPQSCEVGAVPKSDGSNSWGCAKDNDTTYSAGTGLSLSGTQFRLNDTQVKTKKETVECSAAQPCHRGDNLLKIALCPTGSVLLGGGAYAHKAATDSSGLFGLPELVLAWSTPSFSDTGDSGWWGSAVFTSDVTSGSYEVVTSAICSGS